MNLLSEYESMSAAWLTVHLLLVAVTVYLAIIGTYKLILMRQLNRTVRRHSRRIAAILSLVAEGSPQNLAARRSKIISIASDATREVEEDD